MSPLQAIGRRLARFLAEPRERSSHLPTSPPWLLAATLRRGDVLLVEGSSRFATAIKYLTQSTWSHAALCIGDPLGAAAASADEPHVLVDVDVVEGVRTVPLSTFSGLHVRICRPVGLTDEDRDALVRYMLERRGRISYDLKNILDLARFLVRTPPVPGSLKRRMLALGSGEPTKAICSSLLAQAFESIRYPILPEIEVVDDGSEKGRRARREILHIRHHSLYAPRDFDVSPFFAVVKPRLARGFDHQALEWHRPVDQSAAPASDSSLRRSHASPPAA